MPRTGRKKSRTGIYHVVFRGINRQQIFEDDEDYERYLTLLKLYQPVSEYSLYAYCLMPNHIHLLIKEGKEDLGQAFKRIGASFVYWYNLKYDRAGHLFQDRYKSEPVEDDGYLLTVARYIHRNPVKAGLCREPEEYPFSSFARYETDPLIDSATIIEITGKEEFLRYHHVSNEDKCLDIEDQIRKRITDSEAKKIMTDQFHCGNPAAFQNAEKKIQEEIICSLLAAGGSLRQISRLTGATIGVIRKYS